MSTHFPSVRRVLVPVDFSVRSANALRYAVAFASCSGAEIEVLHVWHSDLATKVTVARDRAKATLREFVSALALRGDVELRRRTEHGDAYLTIQRMAQLGDYDLVVVAGSDPGRANTESVALSLLRSATAPVLFVPARCAVRFRSESETALRLERILVPIALAGAELEALDSACELGNPDGASIEALVSSDALPTQIERWRARPKTERVTEFGLPEASELAVPHRVLSARSDLLVLAGKRAHTGERPSDVRLERVALSVECASLSLPA